MFFGISLSLFLFGINFVVGHYLCAWHKLLFGIISLLSLFAVSLTLLLRV